MLLVRSEFKFHNWSLYPGKELKGKQFLKRKTILERKKYYSKITENRS